MALKKQWALLILALLLLGTPLVLLAAGDTPSPTPTLVQTAVRAVLPLFVVPDCDDQIEAPRPEPFDPAQPMPTCWLVPALNMIDVGPMQQINAN